MSDHVKHCARPEHTVERALGLRAGSRPATLAGEWHDDLLKRLKHEYVHHALFSHAIRSPVAGQKCAAAPNPKPPRGKGTTPNDARATCGDGFEPAELRRDSICRS